jgi:hypothetical protein
VSSATVNPSRDVSGPSKPALRSRAEVMRSFVGGGSAATSARGRGAEKVYRSTNPGEHRARYRLNGWARSNGLASGSKALESSCFVRLRLCGAYGGSSSREMVVRPRGRHRSRASGS